MSYQKSVANDPPILLEVENLNVDFVIRSQVNRVIEALSLNVHNGETVAIVGESGSGKSVTSLAIMGLIRKPGVVRSGKVMLHGKDLLAMSSRQRRRYLGRDISTIFQEPTVSLNPSYTVGDQITEVLRLHLGMTRVASISRALQLLHEVGISDPDRCLKSWPHQLSGGMNQRVMIAMAISCNPQLLIADEPTTALDVTVQAQILALLHRLQKKNNMGMIFITHDLLLLPGIAHQVVVMYAGQVVESCKVDDLFEQPLHPYTEALLRSSPTGLAGNKQRLPTIKGMPPRACQNITGCRFHTRCNYASEHCIERTPQLVSDVHSSSRFIRCFHPLNGERSMSSVNIGKA